MKLTEKGIHLLRLVSRREGTTKHEPALAVGYHNLALEQEVLGDKASAALSLEIAEAYATKSLGASHSTTQHIKHLREEVCFVLGLRFTHHRVFV